MISIERLRQVLNYDAVTGLFIWKEKTGKKTKVGKVAGSYGGYKGGYTVINIDGKRYYAHRLAWLYTHGAWPEQLDHKNLNKRDNSIANLREATGKQNVFADITLMGKNSMKLGFVSTARLDI